MSSGATHSLKLAAVLLAGLAALIAAALPAGLAPVRLASFNAPSGEIHQTDHYALGRPQESDWRPGRSSGSSAPADEEMPDGGAIAVAAIKLETRSGSAAHGWVPRRRSGFLHRRTQNARAPPASQRPV